MLGVNAHNVFESYDKLQAAVESAETMDQCDSLHTWFMDLHHRRVINDVHFRNITDQLCLRIKTIYRDGILKDE